MSPEKKSVWNNKISRTFGFTMLKDLQISWMNTKVIAYDFVPMFMKTYISITNRVVNRNNLDIYAVPIAEMYHKKYLSYIFIESSDSSSSCATCVTTPNT